MPDMECRDCGVWLEPTGVAGRPIERCEACRETRYASEVCQRCGEPLPEEAKQESQILRPGLQG